MFRRIHCLCIAGYAPYTLRSLPGKFSGMHLVSMMYVGFKIIAPEQDAGIDLSREYDEAKKLFELEKGTGTG
jgi:hypothetical protein